MGKSITRKNICRRMDNREIKSGVTSRMNKPKGEFHRWIIDEWTKINCPWVRRFDGVDKRAYLRLWEHKCGKMYIIYDITYERRI
jgi:hypothetical protein